MLSIRAGNKVRTEGGGALELFDCVRERVLCLELIGVRDRDRVRGRGGDRGGGGISGRSHGSCLMPSW